MSVKPVDEIKTNLESYKEILSIVEVINSAIESNDHWIEHLNDPNIFLQKHPSEIMTILIKGFLKYFQSIFYRESTLNKLENKNLISCILKVKNDYNNYDYTDRQRAKLFFEAIESILKIKEELISEENTNIAIEDAEF